MNEGVVASFSRLQLDPISIEATLHAREIAIVTFPSCRFGISLGGSFENRSDVINSEIIYRSDDITKAERVRAEVERYLLRHFPGRVLKQEGNKTPGGGGEASVCIVCFSPVSEAAP